MEWNVLFFVNSVLLGVGLTMDAFSVSLANGLNEPKMRKKKMCGVAGVCIVSGIDANDRVDMCTYDRAVFPGV